MAASDLEQLMHVLGVAEGNCLAEQEDVELQVKVCGKWLLYHSGDVPLRETELPVCLKMRASSSAQKSVTIFG